MKEVVDFSNSHKIYESYRFILQNEHIDAYRVKSVAMIPSIYGFGARLIIDVHFTPKIFKEISLKQREDIGPITIKYLDEVGFVIGEIGYKTCHVHTWSVTPLDYTSHDKCILTVELDCVLGDIK